MAANPKRAALVLNREARRALTDLLTASARSSEEPPATFFMRSGISVSLSSEEFRQYGHVLSLLAPARTAKRPRALSAHALRAHLHDAIIAVVPKPNIVERTSHETAELVQGALREFEQRLALPPQQWHVRFPVEGIRLKQPVRVGAVTFQQPTRVLREQWLKRSPKLFSDFKNDVERLDRLAWASLSVIAVDERAATDLGVYVLQLALDLVNLYAPFLNGPEGAAAYIPGVRGVQWIASLSRPVTKPEAVRFERSVKGPWPIDLATLHRLPAYRRLSVLISKDEPLTDFEERLLSSIRWIGRGASSAWNEESLLDFVIALESLILGPRRDQELGFRLRLRCAYLLAKRREHRDRLFDVIGKLYGLRSAVVHKGSFEVPAHMRQAARRYATQAIIEMARRPHFSRMQSHDDLDRWFDRLVLAISTGPKRTRGKREAT